MESLLSEKGLRLLLVTEDEQFAQTLYKYLTPLGYNMDMASSGTAGWKRASSSTYDALLIDIALSGMDGLTLCRPLRDEVGLETPILMFMDGESLEAKVLGLNWAQTYSSTKLPTCENLRRSCAPWCGALALVRDPAR